MKRPNLMLYGSKRTMCGIAEWKGKNNKAIISIPVSGTTNVLFSNVIIMVVGHNEHDRSN